MTELAEQLTAWREIATLSFSGSKRTFIANLFAKGKFLLGVTKIILSFKTAQGLVRHYAYGFPEQTDYEAYIQAKKNADNVIYRTVTKHGYSGQFLIEIDHKPSPGEEPLLTAITQRICEAISFWQLEEALLSAYRKQEENVSLLNSLNDSDCANVGIYLKNIAGVYKMVNSYWARLFAKEPAQMVGRTDFDLLPDKIGQIIAAAEQKTIQTGVAEHYLQKIQLGWQEIWLQMVNYPVYNQEQELIGIGGIAVDITDTKENELRLRYSSAYDILTGLYNRNYFEEQMEALAANEDNYPVSVICLDINDLKIVNDTWGHDKGDQLLKEIGMLVKHYFKAPAFLARVGGDEFAALLPKTDGEKAAALCKKIRHTIEQHNRQSSDIPINVSLGVATCDAPLTPLAKTFKEADNAMYLDKLRRTGNTKNILLSIFNKALAERDFSFVDHGERLSKLASGFGEYLGLSEQEIGQLCLLVAIHDMGYIALPDQILFKQGPLTAEERMLIQNHPEIGYRIAMALPDLEQVAHYILHHHEWWNGNGYPLGIKGEEIPFLCRIIAIIDTYDAITSSRPYREAQTHEFAVSELKQGAGKQFDPDLVAKFLRYLDEKGVGAN